jgi:methylated-DNA-[protein]-cysteine S-methyltransferase
VGFVVLFHTPLGTVGLACADERVVALALPSQTENATERAVLALARRRRPNERFDLLPEASWPAWVRATTVAVASHLGGRSNGLLDVPVDLTGLPEFRRKIYEAARQIQPGERVSYADLAEQAGNRRAARAVGRAMAENPVPVVIPCHRVVDSRGELHGFSAPGGLRTKALLLSIEREAAALVSSAVPSRGRQASLNFR